MKKRNRIPQIPHTRAFEKRTYLLGAGCGEFYAGLATFKTEKPISDYAREVLAKHSEIIEEREIKEQRYDRMLNHQYTFQIKLGSFNFF